MTPNEWIMGAYFAIACPAAAAARWAAKRRARRERAASADQLAAALAKVQPAGLLASAVTCSLCNPSRAGTGRCTCTGQCGHPDCVGDHTSLSGLTVADVRWLRAQKIRGLE